MSVTDVTAPSNHQEAPPPPVVKGWPLVGVVPQVMRHQLDFIHESFLKYGDIFTLDLGVTDIVCLNHPDYAQHIWVENFRNYHKGSPFWDRLRNVLGNGLSVSEGEDWRRQRRLFQPHFHKQKMQKMVNVMVEAIEESLVYWQNSKPDEPFDVAHAMTHTTMRVIVKTMFGSNISEEDIEKTGQNIEYIIKFIFRAMFIDGLPSWMPDMGQKKYAEAIQGVEDLLFKVIDERRKSGELTEDFLSMLIQGADAEGEDRITPTELRDQALTMFAAGYETTSVALALALHYIAQYPEIQEKAYAEAQQVLGSNQPNSENVLQLVYLRQIFQESLRCYSSIYWVPRVAINDDVIGGYKIKAGQIVAIVTHNIHHNPQFWDDPDRFDPDRFTPEEVKKRHHLAWLPFGAGQRYCSGREFALIEAQAVLAIILQKYKLVPVPGHTPIPQIGATLRIKNGIMVYLHPR